MHTCADEQELAIDFLNIYYGAWILRNGSKADIQLEWKCPAIEDAPKCFCLTNRELSLFCAYQEAERWKTISFSSKTIPIPTVDNSIVHKYLSSLEECNTSYKKRNGLKFSQSISPLKNQNRKNLSRILSETYVFYRSIAHCSNSAGKMDDNEWSETLIYILAGLLYYNNHFSKVFFIKVANILLETNTPKLFQAVKEIIKAIDQWHKVENNISLKNDWRSMTMGLFSQAPSFQSSVYDGFMHSTAHTRLTWETTEKKPAQWSMQFIRCIQSQTEYSYWSLRYVLGELLNQPNKI